MALFTIIEDYERGRNSMDEDCDCRIPLLAIIGTVLLIVTFLFILYSLQSKVECLMMLNHYDIPNALEIYYADTCIEDGKDYVKKVLRLNGYEKYGVELP